MRGKLWFIGGLAAGFVLGARAGREKYEELMVNARKVLDHPTVQEAAGVAQAQANRLYSEGKDRLGQTRLGEKLGVGNDRTQELSSTGAFAGSTAGAGAGSTKTGTASTPASSSNKSSGAGANNSTTI